MLICFTFPFKIIPRGEINTVLSNDTYFNRICEEKNFESNESRLKDDNCFLSKYVVMSDLPPLLNPNNASAKPTPLETPDYFNWRDYEGMDWTTPAKNQSYCGSCWMFAALACLESIVNIRERNPDLDLDLSEQYVLSCFPDAGSCFGGWAYLALSYMMATSPKGNFINGAILESCYPYRGIDADGCDCRNCNHDPSLCSYKCDDWRQCIIPISDCGFWIPDGSNEDGESIKTQIMEYGPIVSSMHVTEEFCIWGEENHDPKDYFPYQYAFSPNHQCVIVGWKDDPSIEHGGYWICKNSWGADWGYNGFFNIEYGSLCIDSFRITWVDYNPNNTDNDPIAYAGGPYYGNVSQQIIFNASSCFESESDIVSYIWDFGDGSFGTGITVGHRYLQRGIYNVKLTVKDYKDRQGVDETFAIIDPWDIGDSWTYHMYAINLTLGDVLFLHGSSDKLYFNVTDETNDLYKLSFSGRIKGDVKGGCFSKFVRISGNIIFEKPNFVIKTFKAYLNGILLLNTNNNLLHIPLPFNTTMDVNFDPYLDIFPFPFIVGEGGGIPDVSINNQILVRVFGIPYHNLRYIFSIDKLPYLCLKEEEITVEAGTFDAYRIFFAEELNYSFSPEICNVVKLSIDLCFGYFVMRGELISTNYS